MPPTVCLPLAVSVRPHPKLLSQADARPSVEADRGTDGVPGTLRRLAGACIRLAAATALNGCYHEAGLAGSSSDCRLHRLPVGECRQKFGGGGLVQVPGPVQCGGVEPPIAYLRIRA